MLMFQLAAAAAAASQTPPPACLKPGPTDVVLQNGRVTFAGDEGPETLLAAAVAAKEPEFAGAFGVSGTEILVWREDCRPVYRQSFSDASVLRFEPASLGGETFLHVVAFYPGGSGHLYRHQLLRFDTLRGELRPLAPLALGHTNMGGFFVGDLGPGRGPGIALWDADWQLDEGHYEPHRVNMTLYRWSDNRFAGPELLVTPGKVEAEPDAGPAALGLPIRDMSGHDLFYPEEKLIGAGPE